MGERKDQEPVSGKHPSCLPPLFLRQQSSLSAASDRDKKAETGPQRAGISEWRHPAPWSRQVFDVVQGVYRDISETASHGAGETAHV